MKNTAAAVAGGGAAAASHRYRDHGGDTLIRSLYAQTQLVENTYKSWAPCSLHRETIYPWHKVFVLGAPQSTRVNVSNNTVHLHSTAARYSKCSRSLVELGMRQL